MIMPGWQREFKITIISCIFCCIYLSLPIWVEGRKTNIPTFSVLLLSLFLSIDWFCSYDQEYLPVNRKGACSLSLNLHWMCISQESLSLLLWRTFQIATSKILSRNKGEHWSHTFVGTAGGNTTLSAKPSLNFSSNSCVSVYNATRLFHTEIIMGKQEFHTFDVPNWSTLGSRILA